MVLNLNEIEAVVIGGSAGSYKSIISILSQLPGNYPIPIFTVLHRKKEKNDIFTELINEKSNLIVRDAEDKEPIKSGYAYFAPSNYHMLLNQEKYISLSVDEPLNYSKPSIDILFESAADLYKDKLLGILLSGANEDGTEGMKKITAKGGICIVQDPKEAEVPDMPKFAIKNNDVCIILKIKKVTAFLLTLINKQ